MADVVVGAKLQLEGDQAVQTVKSFKAQVREATADLAAMSQKFGATSKEAQNAARRVAELNDQMGDAKSLADAFNPDTKFRAFGAAINTVVGGFSAFQGVMGLVGVQSKEVEKALLKVQSAMALSQGIAQLQEGIQTFKNLGAVIQSTTVFQKANAVATNVSAGAMKLFGVAADTTAVSFRVLKTAIVATGIGLLIVAVGELIAMIDEWTSSTESAEEANKRLANSIDAVSAATSRNIKEIDFDTQKRIALAKKAGASDEELQKIRQKGLNSEIVQLLTQYYEKRDIFNRAVKEGKVENEKLIELRKEVDDARQAFADKHKMREIDQLNFDANVAVRRREQAKADAEKFAAEEKARREKQAMADLKDAQDRRQRDLTKGAKIDIGKTPEQIETENKLAAARDYYKGLKDLRTSDLNEEANHTFELRAQARERERDRQVEFENRKALLNATSSLIGSVSELLGKQTIAGKVLGIAQATINTYIGATEVLRAKTTLPEPFGTIAKIANVAAVIATGIKAVKAIVATQVPGAGGGGATPAPLTPTAPQSTSTRLDQTSLNAIGSATTRAFVLETDIQNNRERIQRLNRAARI